MVSINTRRNPAYCKVYKIQGRRASLYPKALLPCRLASQYSYDTYREKHISKKLLLTRFETLSHFNMLTSFLLPALALAATTLASPASNRTSTPAPPPIKYLFTANIASGAPIELGETPAGQRAFQPITGGTFSGPKISGMSNLKTASMIFLCLLPSVPYLAKILINLPWTQAKSSAAWTLA